MHDDVRSVLDFLGSYMGGAAVGIACVVFFDVPIAVAAGIGVVVGWVATLVVHS